MAKEIKISEVKELIEKGMSRKDIAQHFGTTQAEMKRKVWSHPVFKHKKTVTVPVELVDDTAGLTAADVVTEEVVTNQENLQSEAAPVDKEEDTTQNNTDGLSMGIAADPSQDNGWK